ncbi:SusD/RagB family nutrient-binding outer membrane lipoprotein [Dyadobacter sp. LHD-138]|uniref:SusD/RagB family nutrient-binding outer membrane lipoprotein n=1 Tax=Dyadobacter sp. LHD-138 TaxID=3071413 RepID=UPI0027DF7908|nr:SusD/RagB family nutrient-binding outer membrane lipoprotein [Dyadobacter sp. LHD-138]MDQ6481303.1 SusD/RagB family nutrient-binding outer membrane lipoprotein [Dyadobacter sp. LHD-138]
MKNIKPFFSAPQRRAERLKKKISSGFFMVAFIGICLSSCTDDFEKINENPNRPESINSDYLMSNVIVSTAYYYQTQAFSGRPAIAGRYMTLVRTTGYDLFNWGPVGWYDAYSFLMVNKTLAAQAEKLGEVQYLAVSKIMKAFNYSYASDLYGDLPYTDALQSKESNLTHPKYDLQKDIYPDLLRELREANDLLASTDKVILASADMMYGGKALLWRKLANSLRLRMLLRISKNYPAAFTEMQGIVKDKSKYPVFESNADNAEIRYLGDIAANSWPGGALAMIDYDFVKTKASKEVVDHLLARNDPRVSVWYTPVKTTVGSTVDKNEYVGVPNAIDEPASYNGGEDHISQLGAIFRKNSDNMLKASLVTYSEVCFILAEALQSGKITVPGETAESFYNKGIESSMDYYGVKAEAVKRDYYNHVLVKYDGTLEQLITQKWLSMFFKTSEGWFDHRRTGFPKFRTGPLVVNKLIPKRYRYPDSESATNNENYKKAVSIFGTDDEYTLMWYLK